MPVMFEGNQILFVDGKIAMDPACCCTQLYLLTPCDAGSSIVTDTDLSAYVGSVVEITNPADTCYTVSETSSGAPVSVTVVDSYASCSACEQAQPQFWSASPPMASNGRYLHIHNAATGCGNTEVNVLQCICNEASGFPGFSVTAGYWCEIYDQYGAWIHNVRSSDKTPCSWTDESERHYRISFISVSGYFAP